MGKGQLEPDPINSTPSRPSTDDILSLPLTYNSYELVI